MLWAQPAVFIPVLIYYSELMYTDAWNMFLLKMFIS